MGARLANVTFFRPYRAWRFICDVNPGRRSRTRFALGYHRSGFQPCFGDGSGGKQKAAPPANAGRSGQMGAHHKGELTLRARWPKPRHKVSLRRQTYFFFAFGAAALRFSSMAAWAAARRATGTR